MSDPEQQPIPILRTDADIEAYIMGARVVGVKTTGQQQIAVHFEDIGGRKIDMVVKDGAIVQAVAAGVSFGQGTPITLVQHLDITLVWRAPKVEAPTD